MEEKLKIGKIFVKKDEKNVKVCSIIKSDKEDYELWFEVNKEYEKYILTEKADSFLIAVLPYAIKKGLDIIVENGISSRLYYQLTTYLIPMLCNNFNKEKVINIECKLDSKEYNIARAVGTGMSGGIDSFYTLFKHTNLKEKEFNITHLTFFNIGASGSYGGEESRNLYKNRMKKNENFAKKNNFGFISIDSNLSEFLMMHHYYTHTFRSLSCVLLLQKLFSKYYYSSTYEFNDTKITADGDIAHYDILVLSCLSTEDITFYSTGMETNRFNKVINVANFPLSYDFLNVCLDDNFNCNKCNKCKRTMLELYTIDKLNLYKNVFDIDYFYKHKQEYFIWLLKNKRRKDIFSKTIYNEMKKRKKKIPLITKILSFIPDKHDLKYWALYFISERKIKELRHKISDDGWE